MTFSLLISLFFLLGGYFSIHCADSSSVRETKYEDSILDERDWNRKHFPLMGSFLKPSPHIGSEVLSQARTDDGLNQAADDFSEDIADLVDQSKKGIDQAKTGQAEENADDQNKDNEAEANQDEEENEHEENSETTVFHPQEIYDSTAVSPQAQKTPKGRTTTTAGTPIHSQKHKSTSASSAKQALKPLNVPVTGDLLAKRRTAPATLKRPNILRPAYSFEKLALKPDPNSSSVVSESEQSIEEVSDSEDDPEPQLDNDSEYVPDENDPDSDTEIQPNERRSSRRLSTPRKQQKEEKTTGAKDQKKKKTRGSKRKRDADEKVQNKKPRIRTEKQPKKKSSSPADSTGDSEYDPGDAAGNTGNVREYGTRSRTKKNHQS